MLSRRRMYRSEGNPKSVSNMTRRRCQSVGVVCAEQVFFKECGYTTRNHTITFHFTKLQTTVATMTLHWLTCQDLHGATCPRVVHWMLFLVLKGHDACRNKLFGGPPLSMCLCRPTRHPLQSLPVVKSFC